MDPYGVDDGRPDLLSPVEDRRRDHRRRPVDRLGRVVLGPHLLRPDPEPGRVVGQPAQLRVESGIVVEVSVEPGEQVDHLLGHRLGHNGPVVAEGGALRGDQVLDQVDAGQ